jgi:hypothetical protein
MIDLLFYVLAPLALVNVFHQAVIVKHHWLPCLDRALDMGLFWRGRRVFGNHKTVRGLLLVPLMTMMVVFFFAQFFKEHWGDLVQQAGLAAAGYMLAELPNSFLKRQLQVNEGESPSGMLRIFTSLIDHTDSIIGAVVAIALFSPISHSVASLTWVALCGVVVHVLLDSLLKHWRFKPSSSGIT